MLVIERRGHFVVENESEDVFCTNLKIVIGKLENGKSSADLFCRRQRAPSDIAD